MLDLTGIRGIMFDYGGTLDTGGDHWAWVFLDAYAAAGFPLSFDDFRDAYIAGERAIAGMYIPHDYDFRNILDLKVSAQLAALGKHSGPLALKIAGLCHRHASSFAAHAASILSRLFPRYRLAVVSNFYGNLASVLSGFNLLSYLHANIDSTVAGVRKPDPEIFHIGCRALGLATTETLVIGDSLGNDIMPAASIGCHTALVCGRPWPDSSPAHYRPDISGTLDQIAAALI